MARKRLEAEEIISLDCSKCGNEIGQYVVIDGEEFLHIGGILSTGAHGVCVQCGKEFHWSQKGRRVSQLFSKSD